MSRGSPRTVVLAVLISSASAHGLRAEQPNWTDTEIAAGAETIGRAWSTYLTVTQAPWSGTQSDGLRFRSAVSYARTDYGSTLRVGPHQWPARFTYQRAVSEGLIGYQQTVGPVILKGFAGVSADGEWVTTDEPPSVTTTKRLSFKGVLEAWWTITPDTYAQIDLQWRAVYDGAQARARLGTSLPVAGLSGGLELGASAGAAYETARAGAFVRYAGEGGEVSLSAGVGGERTRPDSPYAAAGLLVRF